MLSGLRVHGWMGLADVDLVIGKPFVLFMGLNGVGKSGVAKAITWAITGRYRCDQVGAVLAKKDLPAVVIRDGEKAARVGLMLGPALYLERALTAGGAETLRLVDFQGEEKVHVPGTAAEVQAELYRRLGLDPGRAEAALDSWAFLALPPEQRVAMLFRALGSASAAEVEKRLGERGLRGPEVVRLAGIAADKGFRAAEKAAVELRREAGRELNDLPAAKDAPQVITVNGKERDLETVNVAQLEELLGDYRLKRDELLRSAGADLGAARARVETLEGQVAALKPRAGAEGGPDLEALRLKRTQAAERAKGAGSEEREAAERVAALEREIANLRALVEVAEIAKPETCPAIPGGFECPATAAKLKAHAEKLRARADEAADRKRRAANELDAVALTRDAAKRVREEAEAEERRLAEEYRAADEERLLAVRAQGQLEQVQRDLEAARAALAKAEAAGEQQPTDFMDSRIASIEQVLRARKAWEEAKADTTPQRREALSREREQADQLAQALAPDGVEAELLREALVPLRERLAETGRMLGDVTIGDDLEVRATVNGRPRLYEQLSRSQRLRLGIALQDAIASASGLPLLLVDELDVFQGADRGAVLEVLRGLVDRPYGSVIAFATATKPAKAALPELAVFWIAPGGAVEAAA